MYSARHASYWESLDAAVHCFLLAIQVRQGATVIVVNVAFAVLFLLLLLLSQCFPIIVGVVTVVYLLFSGSREAEAECYGCHVLLGDSKQAEGNVQATQVVRTL